MLVLLLALLSAPPAEPESRPALDLERQCGELDVKLGERARLTYDAQKARDRAAVRYYDAVEAKRLPARPTETQLKAMSDEVLAAWKAKGAAESHLRTVEGMQRAMEKYVAEEKKRRGCRAHVPRG